MPKPKAVLCVHDYSATNIYGAEERAALRALVDLDETAYANLDPANLPEVFRDVEIIFSGWGAPRLDSQFLAAVPKLRAFFYGAGSVRSFVTDEFWERDIPLCSAWAANAVPVAEYTFSQIVMCLKCGYQHARSYRQQRARMQRFTVPGAYDSTVGLVSLGMIGGMVAERLKALHVKVIAYDPFFSPEKAADLGVELVSLEEVFEKANVVSLHTPWLPETEKLITGDLVASLPKLASIINTARGAIVDEDGLIQTLRDRPDLHAVLDVTYPEPPAADSPFWELDNVTITPHIAGSMDSECRRMGQYMIDDCRRFLAGQPMLWQLTREKAANMA